MNLPSRCNSETCANLINEPHQGLCPTGFHIPTNAEWYKLILYVDNDYEDYDGGSRICGDGGECGTYNENGEGAMAGVHLKAQEGWRDCRPEEHSDEVYSCYDTYGFSALPGGYYYNGFNNVGGQGYWWIANEYEGSVDEAYFRRMNYYHIPNVNKGHVDKSAGFSIRCVKD
jgi:uncharacterized protein (TIGR02145 family)